MKMFRKIEDRAIDNLLRARRSEEIAAEPFCKQFDPDLANMYIEHCLTPAERAGYERHISLCAPCRKATVALARMAQAETTALISGPAPGSSYAQAGWLASLRGFFIGLARPQVALAAVAVIALAVSIPLVRSTKNSAPSQMALEAESGEPLARAVPAPSAAPEATPVTPATLVAQSPRERTANTENNDVAGPAVARDENRQQAAPAASGEKTDQQPVGEAAGAAATADAQKEVQKNEVKSEPPPAESERRVAQETARESDAAPKPAAPAPQREELARISPEEALRVKKDKDSVSVTPLKPGSPSGDRAKDPTATIRPEDSVAPRSDASTDETARKSRIASDRPGSAFREAESRAATPKRGTPERRIAGKRFYLLNDVWTDKDYKPGKEMAEVTIIRDSDLYKEVLAKRNGLKTYFTRFDENERAIIVYKDTVYKLEPPKK